MRANNAFEADRNLDPIMQTPGLTSRGHLVLTLRRETSNAAGGIGSALGHHASRPTESTEPPHEGSLCNASHS